MSSGALSPEQLAYVDARRVAHLATSDAGGVPHAVPLCHAATASSIYIANGAEASGQPVKRVRNIEQNPAVALVVDHYSEDWDRIGYVLIFGTADILRDGREHVEATRLLRQKYPQFRARRLDGWSVIAVRIERAVSWGDLASGM